MESKNDIINYIDSLSLVLLGILLFVFPLLFTTVTTDTFLFPKQILVGAVSLIVLVGFGIKMLAEGGLKLRQTPFHVPVILFLAVIFISSLLSLNRYDSLIAFVPLLMSVVSYFLIVNYAKTPSALFSLVSALIGGTFLASMNSILTYFNVFLLPIAITKSQSFSPFGSLIDQAMYFAFILPLSLYGAVAYGKHLFPNMQEISRQPVSAIKFFLFSLASLVIASGLAVTVFQLITVQKPTILPFETGFQTAFAAISQDTGRIAQGFFFGSGFGTYMTDFTRFKQPVFNLNQQLWSLTFFRSSSFILELLATTGVLGLGAFVLILFKIVKEAFYPVHGHAQKDPLFTVEFTKYVWLSIVLIAIAAFILPFSFIITTAFFFLLALFSSLQGIQNAARFYDIELYMVALKKGLIAAAMESGQRTRGSLILPIVVFVLILVFCGGLAYAGSRYVNSDIMFQNSLIATSQNNGSLTYQLQGNAISEFPYRDAYRRIFSQTNLALANSLASQQPKDSSPSAQTQQTIYTLTQQSINEGQQAAIVSPLTATNWDNLSSIYRSLIGFGQNAENFAAITIQRTILLDPNNPQHYLNLGGLYYQLGQWEEAQRQFQIAVNLKPDFSNAYYNLGHALEAKGDLPNALAQYETVKTLVAQDAPNLKRINEEIEVLSKKIGTQEGQSNASINSQSQAGQNQQPLEISSPSATLPTQKTPVEIPAPLVSTPSAQ